MSNVFLFANDAETTLAASVGTGATALVLSPGSGAKFPNPSAGQQFSVTLTDAATGLLTEIVYCTARTADVLTVVRAQEGTIAQSWTTGDNVANLLTAGQMSALTQFAVQQYTAGGTANALTLTPTPAATSYGSGQTWNIIPAGTNTGAATLNVSALGAKAIVNPDGSALTASAMIAGGLVQVIYQATLDKFVLMTSQSRLVSALTALTSASSGTYSTPAGARRLKIRMVGGGGGGGAGAGGGATPSAGSNGTASAFNSIAANPGLGGGSSVAIASSANGGYGGSAGGGSAFFRSNGGGGATGIFTTSTNTAGNSGSMGGGSVLGGGGRGGLGGADTVAPGYGGGGSGGNSGNDDGYTGGGGGGGEYVEIIIDAPNATYPYTVGGGGAGGPNLGPGTVFAGQNGSPGAILIEAIF